VGPVDIGGGGVGPVYIGGGRGRIPEGCEDGLETVQATRVLPGDRFPV